MNHKVKLSVFALAVFLVLAALSSCQPEQQPERPTSQTVAIQSDGDSEAEAVVAVSTEIKNVKNKQKELTQSYQSLREQITNVESRIQDLSQQITTLQHRLDANKQVSINHSVAQQDLSLTEKRSTASYIDLAQDVYAPVAIPKPRKQAEKLIWHPMDVVAQTVLPPQAFPVNTTPATPSDSQNHSPQGKKNIQVIPSGTLIKGRLLTGMIGRIPVDGNIADPWPFKIVATGFAHAPNYKEFDASGMVFEGTAQGDYSFSCARGKVHKLTSVTSQDDVISAGGEQGAGIAWVSDERSNPCLPGTYVGNAGSELGKDILLNTVAGVTKAITKAEETRTISADGVERVAVTGDKLKTVGANAVGGVAQGAIDFVSKRSDAWDAIYVAAGAHVVINITKDIPITKGSNKLYAKN